MTTAVAIALLSLLGPTRALAQNETPKLELGRQFALLGLDGVNPLLPGATEPGCGSGLPWKNSTASTRGKWSKVRMACQPPPRTTTNAANTCARGSTFFRRFLVSGTAPFAGGETSTAAEYLLHQTLIGAWPIKPMDGVTYAELVRRTQEHLIKAMREAKVHTSWISPNEYYGRATSEFIEAILKLEKTNRFLRSFAEFHAPIARAGMYNSLAQTLFKITAPGVPDFYQGTANSS